MRFLGTIKAAEDQGAPPPALQEAMGKFIQEAFAAGVIHETGGLGPSAEAVRLRLESGSLHVTDGPFTESREVVGGYVIYEVPSREVALDWSRRFMELHRQHWPGFVGESEVREMRPFGGEPPQ
jgi:hypothetical protein